MKLLYRFTPHLRLSHNPLFVYEVRRVRWGHSGRALLVYSARWLSIIVGVLLLLWLLSSLPYFWSSGDVDFLLPLLVLSLLAALPLDFTFMAAALGSAFSGSRWSLLRLTPLSDGQLIAAVFGAAQVRAWRWMILIIAGRMALSLIAGVNLAAVIFRPGVWSYMTPGQAFTSIVGQLTLIALSLVYVVEPFWRMRTVTALGVAISALTRNRTSSLLAAFGMLAALWLAQAIIAVALILTVSALALPLALVEASVNQFVICAPLLLIALAVASVYGFYSVVQTWSLRYAERRIARST